MLSKTQLDTFKKSGIWYTGVPSYDPTNHISCMKSFLSREDLYKSDFLQTKLDTLFEGYSYLGQENSSNQYAEDQLFTYVLSDYFDQRLHAKEFYPIIKEQQTLTAKIVELERELIAAISSDLLDFYDRYVSHSLSANFYPANGKSELRLTEHPDGSLLTVFPFGMDHEFQFETTEGSWHTIERTNEIVCFAGYLMELMTDIKSLNHKVCKEGHQNERFSFAYFSIPTPGSVFKIKGQEISTESYFQKYLSLFS